MNIDIHALAGAYAVDALDDVERAEFERHLAECGSCQYDVDTLRETAGALSGAAETTPPESLRAAVLQGITEVRPLPPVVPFKSVGRARRRWAAGSLLIAASVAGLMAVVHPWTTDSHPSIATQVLTSADVQIVKSTVGKSGTLTWYRSKSAGRAVVVSSGLAALPSAKVYEVWLQRADGSMAPAGFLSESSSRLVLDGNATKALGAGLTVEPKGGSEQPSTTPIALVSFAG